MQGLLCYSCSELDLWLAECTSLWPWWMAFRVRIQVIIQSFEYFHGNLNVFPEQLWRKWTIESEIRNWMNHKVLQGPFYATLHAAIVNAILNLNYTSREFGLFQPDLSTSSWKQYDLSLLLKIGTAPRFIFINYSQYKSNTKFSILGSNSKQSIFIGWVF